MELKQMVGTAQVILAVLEKCAMAGTISEQEQGVILRWIADLAAAIGNQQPDKLDVIAAQVEMAVTSDSQAVEPVGTSELEPQVIEPVEIHATLIAEPAITAESEVFERPRTDRNAIRALYEDDVPTSVSEPEPLPDPEYLPKIEAVEPVGTAEFVYVESVEPELKPQVIEPVEMPTEPATEVEPLPAPSTEPEPIIHIAPVQTIIGKEKPSRIIGDEHSVRDVNNTITAGVSLGRSISIGDRAIITRDLFDGDTFAYNHAITQFDSFTTLDEALLYIYDHYQWNPDCDGARIVMDKLMAKLG